MRQKSGQSDSSSEQLVKDSRRATRKQYSAEEKIRILLDGYAASIRSRSFAGARDWREPLLQLVEGIPGSWQATAGERYGACGDQRRGQGSSAAGGATENHCCTDERTGSRTARR
jgi:hypothetical protein